MSKTPHSEPHYIQGVIDLQKIDPSPYQHRRHFDEDKLRELAASIQREGLIEPIVVRPKRDRYELIAGECRFRAVRDFTKKELGYEVASEAKLTSNKFIGSVQEIFKNLPKPVKWLFFYTHDLTSLVDICKEAQDISTQHNMNKSQTRALAKLNAVSESEFQRIVNPQPSSQKIVILGTLLNLLNN